MAKLKTLLPAGSTVLEIGSGSGQHAITFSTALPDVTWQPSDQGDYYPGLVQNLKDLAPSNVLSPLTLNMSEPTWPDSFDHVYSANVIHIMSERWLGQFFTSPAGHLFFYGPFKYQGEFTSESNARFDLWLKDRNAESGVRDIETLIELGASKGYQLTSDSPMPANNQFLVFSR